MNNLIKENNTVSELTDKRPNTNYTIDKNGKIWISQNEASRLVGISVRQIKRIMPKLKNDIKLNKFNQLDEDIFSELVIYAAAKGKIQAIDLLGKIVKAGVKVFLYGMAKKEQQQVVPIEQEIKQLKFDNEELRKNNERLESKLNNLEVLFLTHQQEKINPHEIHDQYLEWTNKGWLKCYITNVTKYNYDLTDVGLEHLVQIKNKFRLKENYEQRRNK